MAPTSVRAAVEKLTDQSLLAKIAVDDSDANVRSTAVGRLTDPALMAKVSAANSGSTVEEADVGKLSDNAARLKRTFDQGQSPLLPNAFAVLHCDEVEGAKNSFEDHYGGYKAGGGNGT